MNSAKKIYVATSWRNEHCTKVVNALRGDGHTVYDFREAAFSWESVGVNSKSLVTAETINGIYEDQRVIDGFRRDMDALKACDICVLVLPSGKSAHIEAGFAASAGKTVIIYSPQPDQPELMYMMSDFKLVSELDNLLNVVAVV